MNENISFFQGLQFSIISMLIVFILLYIISLVLSGFKVLFKENKNLVKSEKSDVGIEKNEIKNLRGITLEELESNPDMLVAGIVASMEASGENRKNSFKIISIRKI